MKAGSLIVVVSLLFYVGRMFSPATVVINVHEVWVDPN